MGTRSYESKIYIKNILDELSQREIGNVTFHNRFMLSTEIDDYEITIHNSFSRYTLSSNNRKLEDIFIVSNDIAKDLFELLLKQYTNYQVLVRRLLSLVNQSEIYIKDKIEEFEVIKDHKIDFISLESLYEYFELKFNMNSFLSSTKIDYERFYKSITQEPLYYHDFADNSYF